MPHEDSHAWQYSISASPLGSWLLEDLQSFHLPPQLNISWYFCIKPSAWGSPDCHWTPKDTGYVIHAHGLNRVQRHPYFPVPRELLHFYSNWNSVSETPRMGCLVTDHTSESSWQAHHPIFILASKQVTSHLALMIVLHILSPVQPFFISIISLSFFHQNWMILCPCFIDLCTFFSFSFYSFPSLPEIWMVSCMLPKSYTQCSLLSPKL